MANPTPFQITPDWMNQMAQKTGNQSAPPNPSTLNGITNSPTNAVPANPTDTPVSQQSSFDPSTYADSVAQGLMNRVKTYQDQNPVDVPYAAGTPTIYKQMADNNANYQNRALDLQNKMYDRQGELQKQQMDLAQQNFDRQGTWHKDQVDYQNKYLDNMAAKATGGGNTQAGRTQAYMSALFDSAMKGKEEGKPLDQVLGFLDQPETQSYMLQHGVKREQIAEGIVRAYTGMSPDEFIAKNPSDPAVSMLQKKPPANKSNVDVGKALQDMGKPTDAGGGDTNQSQSQSWLDSAKHWLSNLGYDGSGGSPENLPYYGGEGPVNLPYSPDDQSGGPSTYDDSSVNDSSTSWIDKAKDWLLNLGSDTASAAELSPNETGNSALNAAFDMQRKGNIHYQFGGNDAAGGSLDCSSFTQQAFKQAGVDIGRNTESQWTSKKGQYVSSNDLQPGDLVFFKDTYDSGYKDGVSHVGIYQGDGKFINNNDSGVRVDNLNSPYWSGHYLGAKRVQT